MPAAIPAMSALAAGAAAALGFFPLAAVITIAGAAAAIALTRKPDVGYRDQSERKQILRAAASPKTVVYGETETAGTLFFAEEEPGKQEKGEKLYLAITLAGHELSAIGDVYLGDEAVWTYGKHADVEFHNNAPTADPYLLKNAPSWRDDMAGRGIAWLRATLTFDAEIFPAGIPNIKVNKKGWALYDPRTGETKYSNNAALVILHFYRHYLGVEDSEINWAQFQEAANICDERVPCGETGNTEARYTINGEWDLSEKKSSVLDDMLVACAGDPTFIGGRHGLLVGAYYGPAVDEINESQLAGDIDIMPEVAQRERVNTITGTFIDPQQGFTEADFPVVQVQEWLEEDGGEIVQDMKLRFVTSEFQAQRLADIKLKRTRTARTMNLPLNLSGYRYRPGMYVTVNLPSIGITGAEMRVTDWAFSIERGVTLTVKQESIDVWNDAIGQPVTRPPLTELPTGGIAQPQAVTYSVEEIGDVVQGILSWHNIGPFAYNQVLIKQHGTTVMAVQVPDSLTRISGLVRGVYTAHISAVSHMGARSPEAWLEFVIQAPDIPSHVRVEQGFFSVSLYPQLAQLTNVSTQFDFWTSGDVPLADCRTATVENNATRAGMGHHWASHGLKNNQTYYWYVRSINAFGTSDFIQVEAFCLTESGDLMQVIDDGVRGSEAFLNMSEQLNTNLEAAMENAIANNANYHLQQKQYGDVKASILVVSTTVATVEKAMAEMERQVQAEMGELTAAVNEKMTAVISDDGTASAAWTLRLGIQRGDTYYSCGMGMAIEPKGEAFITTTTFNADQFGIYTGNNPGHYESVFFAQNGQVFINSACIKELSVTNEKIGGYIRSDNYVAGKTGWNISKDGSAEFQSGTFRGAVFAESGIFTGTVYAKDGDFAGTVYANKIKGDIVNAYSLGEIYHKTSSSEINNILQFFSKVNVVLGNSYPCTVAVPTVTFFNASAHYNGELVAEIVIGGVVVASEPIGYQEYVTLTGSRTFPAGAANQEVRARIRGQVKGKDLVLKATACQVLVFKTDVNNFNSGSNNQTGNY